MNTAITSARLNTLLDTDRAGQAAPSAQELEVREKFQDFVAGTFFKQMLKSLRSTQGTPAYLHGGQAEQVFQAQMDEKIAEQMARQHGQAFAGPLFDAYVQAPPAARYVPGWDNRASAAATNSHSTDITSAVEEREHAFSVTV